MVLDTPISHILLALDGKMDFIKKTNPWGSGKDKEEEAELTKLKESQPNAELAAQQLLGFVKRRQGQAQRLTFKPPVR